MGSLRFRKSIEILPGLRLNLTRNGFSTTVGSSPLSFNIGPKGIYRNVGIPGTGLWSRQRIAGNPSGQGADVTEEAPANEEGPYDATGTEIESADVRELGSASQQEFQDLLENVHQERLQMASELGLTKQKERNAFSKFDGWNRGFLLKRCFPGSFVKRKADYESVQRSAATIEEALSGHRLSLGVQMEPPHEKLYAKLRAAFSGLARSERIWDITRSYDTGRSGFDMEVDRTPVSFSSRNCDVIDWTDHAFCLGNANGGELYIYPAFIVYGTKKSFAVLDTRDVDVGIGEMYYVENEPVPKDSPVRQIDPGLLLPEVTYGRLALKSSSGLHEEYLISNLQALNSFRDAWNAFYSLA